VAWPANYQAESAGQIGMASQSSIWIGGLRPHIV
jgi:hypothetical protein